MEIELSTVTRITKKLNNRQLHQYSEILQRRLIDAGIAPEVVLEVIKGAVQELRLNDTFALECAQAFEGVAKATAVPDEQRVIDRVGRILVEYCFFRIPETKLIWPEGATEDKQSREKFTPGVLPRPLMRYFLISVRGAIPELDQFDANSILFGVDNAEHEELKKHVDALIDKIETNTRTNKATLWEAVYSDVRFQRIALKLIKETRVKLESLGLEHYLRIIHNLRQRDPEKTRVNTMKRPFILEDVQMIDDALREAERALGGIAETS